MPRSRERAWQHDGKGHRRPDGEDGPEKSDQEPALLTFDRDRRDPMRDEER
jgi:hypothetical protein